MLKTKISVLILTFVLLLTVSLTSVFAVPSPWITGDANTDREFNVKDATAIQKYVSMILSPTKLQVVLSDADGDTEITVRDATLIQKVVAGIIDRGDIKWEGIFTYMILEDFRSSFSSGMAMVGTPVSFTLEVNSPAEPITYEFYVNETLVQERGHSNVFTHTFESSGSYEVKAVAYNKYDETLEKAFSCYNVKEAYTSEVPLITMVHHHSPADFFFNPELGCTVTVDALFGEAPYEFKFEQYFEDAEGKRLGVVKTSEFSNSKEFVLSEDHEYQIGYAFEMVKVTVKDANGSESFAIYDVNKGELK